MSDHPILLKNGRLFDPKCTLDTTGSLLIENGRVSQLNPSELPADIQTIDLEGKWVLPGFIDMHVHLREPGEEYKETVDSGTKAAAAGGFTAVACMPNTKPALDSEQGIALIIHKAKKAAARVYPVGAISKGLKGLSLSEFSEMQKAGAVALTDDGMPVLNSQLMRRAMEYAGNFDMPVISHAEEMSLSSNGVMNEGNISTRLGLTGIPHIAEEIMVYRDLALAEYTGQPLHLAHISTKESVSLIRRSKARGCPVTAETAPHYFTLTEEAVGQYDTYAKMNPPLRSLEDQQAIKEGLQDGTIDVIASDHAPHSDMEKHVEFDRAANGIIGLETSVPLALRLVNDGLIDLKRLVELFSINPAKILAVEDGLIKEGGLADLTIIDPSRTFTYSRESIVSKSTNSPFIDWQLTGKAVMTIVGGRITYDDM